MGTLIFRLFLPLQHYIIFFFPTSPYFARMKNFLLLLMLILPFRWAKAQNTIGLPEIINYTKKQYGAGSQNWDIKKDKQGFLYFANNDGLITFDGTHWKLYALPNKSIVRSVAIGKDNKIYVGGQEEFGYFYPDSRGRLVYQSLKPLVPKDESSFADVWNIVSFENAIFFRSNRKIFRYSQNKITAYNSIDWPFMGESNGQLLAQEYERGLLRYQNGYWIPFLKQKIFTGTDKISSVVSAGEDSSLLFTRTNAYLLKGDSVSTFSKGIIPRIVAQKIYASAKIDNDLIALATNLQGCFIVNRNGELIQRLARQDGIQNNNILSIFADEKKNIWLGLDNGIDFIAYNSAIKKIKPDQQNNYAGYTSIIYQGKLYLGTSAGVFSAPLYKNEDLSFVQSSFDFIKNSTGQVWTISEINGKLLMGHNNGAYSIETGQAYPIDPTSGFWTFQPLSNIMPSSRILAGCYNGVNFYDYKNNKFSNPSLHAHFESARYVANENGILWIAHPYKGLYNVTIDDNSFNTQKYADKKGILSPNDNYLFRLSNKTVLCTRKGIYELDPKINDFVPSVYFTAILGNAIPSYMKEDKYGNIWFVYNKTPGVIDMSGEKPSVQYFSELRNKITAGGYEFIDPVDENNVFIAGEEGFYHLNPAAFKNKKQAFVTHITSVKAMNKKDSLLYDGYAMIKAGSLEKINSSWNTFRFEYAATLYGSSNLEYSYRLTGFDRGWSVWSAKTEKEYTNLPSGNYTFEVKSRSGEGNESLSIAIYSFSILPPWYQTYPAYFGYVILITAVIYLLYKQQQKRLLRQQQKHEKEQKQLQYLHQLEIDKAEKELVKLKNEKLEAEIHHKNTELASSTMHLVQKGELLSKIKDKLIKLDKEEERPKSSEEFKGIIKILGQEDRMDANWDQFAAHFNEVHGDFLLILKKKFTDLTPNELKLCAYLRMNMSTKEIAQLMNISVRGVEISRYRLRKKLGLKTSENIFDMLIKLDGFVQTGENGSDTGNWKTTTRS